MSSTSSLRGRVALVTGSSRGIGRAIALAFAQAGASVGVTYRSREDEALEVARECGDALALPLDVTSRADVQRAVELVLERWGRLDVLVNNAGYLKQEPFETISEESWDHTLNVNLKGPFLCTQVVQPVFERQGSGCIINVSSVGGQFGGPKAPHYAASKAALLAFTKSSARLFAPQGVRVNAIAPGFIRTEMIADLLSDEQEAEIAAGLPLGRIGEPRDVADAALYLAGAADFVTGAVINVNGGQWMG